MFGIKTRLLDLYNQFCYQNFTGSKVKKIRNKNVIDVAFVVTELEVWKTELLFQEMVNHNRFNPFILVVSSKELPHSKWSVLKYCKEMKYNYYEINDNERLDSVCHFDILFYQKPYSECYFPIHRWIHYRSALLCWVKYGFHLIHESYTYNSGFQNYAWQLYYENDDCLAGARQLQRNGATNCYVTGVPMSDELMKDKRNYNNPWKCSDNRKRIIYAPHHTIGDINNGLVNNLVNYGTFLDYGEVMLELARKYSDDVFFAFKPHPLLKIKLEKFWGKKKTCQYYSAWSDLKNGQYVIGKYDGLFKYSDAMIHDCSSFTLEYHYTQNPIMYLVKDIEHINQLNSFGQHAFELHYKGYTSNDIEQFVQNVINGIDPLKDQRKCFYDDCLVPPNGKTACENIVNCILGTGEYGQS